MGDPLESCGSFSSMELGNQICLHEHSLEGGVVHGLLKIFGWKGIIVLSRIKVNRWRMLLHLLFGLFQSGCVQEKSLKGWFWKI